MYGDIGNKLIQEARRAANLWRIPAFNNELITGILKEQKEILATLESYDITDADRLETVSYLLLQLAFRRNKRCLLVYQRLRTEKIEEQLWGDQETNQNDLSGQEQSYLRNYSDLLVDYKGEWTDVDLTGSIEPPTSMYVEVRVLQDVGEIQGEYGVFNLVKGSQHYVRASEVQRLVQQGFVEVV